MMALRTQHTFDALPFFKAQRRDLLAGAFSLLRQFGSTNLSYDVLTQPLLCGGKVLPYDHRNILESTLHFSHKTGLLA